MGEIPAAFSRRTMSAYRHRSDYAIAEVRIDYCAKEGAPFALFELTQQITDNGFLTVLVIGAHRC
jgi:hypothetical protein